MLLAHAPAGYLLTRFLTRTVFKKSIDPERSNRFYQAVMFAGLIGAILPDVDFIYHLFFDPNKTPHHSYITHMPILWISLTVLSIVTGKLFKNSNFTIVSVTACLSALLHLVCDTITGVIYWLYPLNNKAFNVFSVSDIHIWWVQNYLSHWTFLIEIAIVFLAMVIFLRVKETAAYLMFLFRRSVRLRGILMRMTVCFTAIVIILLVGLVRFDIDKKILKKLSVKAKVIKTAFSQ